MENFDYATCHNLRPYKMNNNNGWWRSIFQNNNIYHPKILIVPNFDGLMKSNVNMMSPRQVQISCIRVAHWLFLHNFN